MTNAVPPFNPILFPQCFTSYDKRFLNSAWIEHVPFAFSLVQMLKPNNIVELGTYGGASYCAFCQVVSDLALSTRCYGIDTWEGDEHAGYYGNEVYEYLKSYHDTRFPTFSTLIRKTFDEANCQFCEDSIDLLHIDGLHTYEAVRHDFETWLPKMSSKGVVLFHDTAVKSDGFGVHRFWDEVKSRFPSFSFQHGYGLGVLAVGPNIPESIQILCGTAEMQQNAIRSFFASLGSHYSKDLLVETQKNTIFDQHKQICTQEDQISSFENSLSWRVTKPLRKLSALIKR